MTIRELSQLYYLNREISDLKLKIAEIEAKATDTSVKITGMPHAPTAGDKIGKLIAELDYYKSTLNNRLEQCRLELAVDAGGGKYRRHKRVCRKAYCIQIHSKQLKLAQMAQTDMLQCYHRDLKERRP